MAVDASNPEGSKLSTIPWWEHILTGADGEVHENGYFDDDSDVLNIAALEALQTDEQRQVLDIIDQLRKCGLESVLSLPQLVVCGDQSSGKSSCLEALYFC